ncbi:hypothetical protein [Streptomyces sp. SID161]|uniref:hypothetical protein n=1 Tax=Streptomyces sp. SID161 TaxID=2690251 RepID=UPI00136AA2CE|nr:hypothetical protein [Streptomyces sp. SID161]MYW48863.1 hypothetical protein [Streptomyces sp. SID161]MYW49852.1 hypothetical protein [Streptomyces sp. SID161]
MTGVARLIRASLCLATGSALLARHLGRCATVWVARGRRHDLTGWKAALGCWLRLAGIALLLYGLWWLVRRAPALMCLLAGIWMTASWRSGRPPAEDVDGADEAAVSEAAPTLDREAVRTLLLTLMGGGSGVHLRTVLAYLQQQPSTAALTAGWKVADLRARLVALKVPVDRGVKVGGVPTWGVRRRDLQAPSPATAQETSPEASTAA